MTNASNPSSSLPTDLHIAFIGGGNMASAIIGGLVRQGMPAKQIQVVEPFDQARSRLQQDFGIAALEQAGPELSTAGAVVWAVKPQMFSEAAKPVRPHVGQALQISVAAGIRSDSIAAWLGSERIVRTMPNTPALVGKGMTALYPRHGVGPADRSLVEQLLQPTGALMWMDQEQQLDAVTALTGSGPAYVFYFMEAMTKAGTDMGLSAAQAQQLAVANFVGAADLAQSSSEPPEVLRQRVTSKGGTTYAALTSMEQDGVGALFIKAMHAAQKRAGELGDEFGGA